MPKYVSGWYLANLIFSLPLPLWTLSVYLKRALPPNFLPRGSTKTLTKLLRAITRCSRWGNALHVGQPKRERVLLCKMAENRGTLDATLGNGEAERRRAEQEKEGCGNEMMRNNPNLTL